MPSIELVCIGQKEPLTFAGMPFALVADRELVSHRSPRPLFQRELSKLRGCMYHIGNPDCAKPGYDWTFYAYEVLSPTSREQQRNRFFEVGPEFYEGFRGLIRNLLEASPEHSVFFYTDWQFGPARTTRAGVISEADFWLQYESHLIKLNACYTILRDAQPKISKR